MPRQMGCSPPRGASTRGRESSPRFGQSGTARDFNTRLYLIGPSYLQHGSCSASVMCQKISQGFSSLCQAWFWNTISSFERIALSTARMFVFYIWNRFCTDQSVKVKNSLDYGKLAAAAERAIKTRHSLQL